MKRSVSSFPRLQLIGVSGIPIVKAGDDLGGIIARSAEKQGTRIMDGDIVVVEQKIVSKAENRVVNLSKVKPSEFASKLARQTEKEPELVEIVLREARSVVRVGNNNIITRTAHGFICANSGVDRSNVSGGNDVTLLPRDPDASARRIQASIKKHTGRSVVVLISDTFGRPFREGVANVCIGVSGLKPILDLRGKRDIFGYQLKIKQVAVADELASAGELVAGNADERIPVVIIRGYKRYQASEKASALELIRPEERDLFL